MKNYKVGDWVYFEFKLHQVKTIKDGYIELTDGCFCTSGNSIAERMVPLSIETKRLSDDMQSTYNRFMKKHDSRLNYTGGIIGKLSEIWLEACRANDPNILDQACGFLEAVGDGIDSVSTIQGARIFPS